MSALGPLEGRSQKAHGQPQKRERGEREAKEKQKKRQRLGSIQVNTSLFKPWLSVAFYMPRKSTTVMSETKSELSSSQIVHWTIQDDYIVNTVRKGYISSPSNNQRLVCLICAARNLIATF